MPQNPVSWSHVNDAARDKTPPTKAQVDEVINKIIVECQNQGLSAHDTAYVLAMTKLESGFNPNAANPTSSATGLAQFVDKTGEAFGINDENRWNVDNQVRALVKIYQYDKKIAEKNDLGEAGIYGAHHDGAAGVLKDNAPGIQLANDKVLPEVENFEKLINQKIEAGQVTPFTNTGSSLGGTSSPSSPIDLPNGDSEASDPLPDGTRVVSTSTTVNGQTTVTAQLLDKEGNVLLSAGAGQTMERDPETGIVQVRTGDSDQVQQYNPETGQVTNELRTGSEAAAVYESLIDAFEKPQLIFSGEGVQVANAEGNLPSLPESDTVDVSPPEAGLTLEGTAAGIGLFNAISNVQNWDHLSDLGKLSALAGLHNALAGVGTDLPGDFSGTASWLSLAQGIESGNVAMTVVGLNSVSDGAIDGALNSALGSSGVPYVSVAANDEIFRGVA